MDEEQFDYANPGCTFSIFTESQPLHSTPIPTEWTRNLGNLCGDLLTPTKATMFHVRMVSWFAGGNYFASCVCCTWSSLSGLYRFVVDVATTIERPSDDVKEEESTMR